tara:strand:+ start:45975 stop:46421 length:447 start_codon:yes stop_codon:yes gene_type:complete
MSKEWATPTWYLFHTIASRLDETYFNSHLIECKNLVQNICGNLPCPICQNHAIYYLKTTNFHRIRTLAQFREYLFIFHNFVNTQLGKKKFTKAEMEKYNRANIDKIILLFYHKFKAHYRTGTSFVGWRRRKALGDIANKLLKMRSHMK